MSDDKAHLRTQAARCRRLAADINDAEAKARLLDMAQEFDRDAAAPELDAAVPPRTPPVED